MQSENQATWQSTIQGTGSFWPGDNDQPEASGFLLCTGLQLPFAPPPNIHTRTCTRTNAGLDTSSLGF